MELAKNFGMFTRDEAKKQLVIARKEKNSSDRCFELSMVAQKTPDQHQVRLIVDEAVTAAKDGKDQFHRVIALAWPLRTLLERDELKVAEDLLNIAMKMARKNKHPASKSIAQDRIFSIIFCSHKILWQETYDELVDASLPIVHWRQGYNLQNAIMMIHQLDPQRAQNSISRIDDAKVKIKIENALAKKKSSDA